VPSMEAILPDLKAERAQDEVSQSCSSGYSAKRRWATSVCSSVSRTLC
jgi:hypothetical protein